MTRDEAIEIVFKKKYPTSREAVVIEVDIWESCGLFKPDQEPVAVESAPSLDDVHGIMQQ